MNRRAQIVAVAVLLLWLFLTWRWMSHLSSALPAGADCVATRFISPIANFDICVWSATDDPVVSAELRTHGTWEAQKMAQWVRALTLFNGTATVLDVGANVGVFALAAKANGARRVIAVEPVPAHVAMLRESIRRNGVEVAVIAAAASNASGTAEMLMALDNRGGSSLSNANLSRTEKVAVRLVRLDDVVPERVDVVKVDVEGHESCVLSGARRVFGAACLVFLEFWPGLQPCGSSDAFLSQFDVFASFDDWEAGGPPMQPTSSSWTAHLSQFQSIFGTQRLIELFLVRRGCVERPFRPPVTLPPELVAALLKQNNG